MTIALHEVIYSNKSPKPSMETERKFQETDRRRCIEQVHESWACF